jgi:hypothetical protein
MADIIINVIEPAETFDLLSLAEFKLSTGVPEQDTSQDAEIQLLITRFSDVVATTCNRVFAKETLSETWRCLGCRRIFLSHWPAQAADIQMVECPRGSPIDPSSWELEPQSGKLELFASQSEPIVVTYTGGFNLPDEAPPALKQATELLIRENRALSARLETSGIRMIAHKEARVMYFDPLALLTKSQGFGWATSSANALLMRYTRFPV